MSSNKIKHTAMRLFTEHGYEGTSLADISEIVGIKKSSIYNHYKSKDDLFFYIFEHCSQTSLAVIKDLLRDADQKTYPQLIRELLEQVIMLFPTHYETKFLFRFICYTPLHIQKDLDALLANYLSQISALFQITLYAHPQTASEKDAEYFSLHFRIIVYGLYSSYLCKNILPPQDVINYFVDALSVVCRQKSESSIIHI